MNNVLETSDTSPAAAIDCEHVVTGPGGQVIHPDSVLMDALTSADIAGRAVTRSRYFITAGA